MLVVLRLDWFSISLGALGTRLALTVVIYVVFVFNFVFMPTTDGSMGGEDGPTQLSEDQLEEPAVKKQRTEG